ncbi:MAG: pyridoxal phosphate-dependent aminotransferase [Burkholderiaceae bacterium]|nr:pyridoxal phosphate-dependent aminotransferase [Burkholderiaceae bacterium]
MSATQAPISRFVAGIEISAIKEMAMRSARVEGAASLSWGLPSFQTPAAIRDAVTQALASDPDIGKYALPDGLPELRRLVAEVHRDATGIEVDPDANVLITAGNMQGLNALLHVLVDPGSEVVLTDPGFASHVQQIRLCGGEPVFWALDESRDWALDVETLPSLLGPRTRAIVIVSPSNPTGRIFTEAELRRVGEIAREAGVFVLIDDPYSHFTYENRSRCFNLSSVEAMREHLAYLFTFSKCHAMSGWRLGYMIVPAYLKREVLKVHDATLICTPRISQVAGIAALSGASPHVHEFEQTLARRRELICQRLDALPHVFDYVRPQGAYYVFPRIRVAHECSREFSIRLLEQARVSVTPGAAFGPRGEHHVRMAYCVDEDTIERAFDRIERQFGQG